MVRGLCVLVAVTLCFSVSAFAEGWSIHRVDNGVSVSVDGKNWQLVRPGQAVADQSWIKTGPRGRVILARGNERIVYRANTLAAISMSGKSDEKTLLTQRTGSILLSVQKRRRAHTSVVTPHLAAVVKGTVFEVTVDSAESEVRVDQGVVEIEAEDFDR